MLVGLIDVEKRPIRRMLPSALSGVDKQFRLQEKMHSPGECAQTHRREKLLLSLPF